MFVIDASPWAEEEPALADFKKTFINAEIYEFGEQEDYFSEGCLSLPGLYEDVKRPTSIRIRYVDENWEEHDEFYDGYAARVIQHEYDHLEGKVFTDRLSPLRKKLVKGKLTGFTKGKYKAAYRTK
jgi:peptide deformylase